jgi:ribonuclease D
VKATYVDTQEGLARLEELLSDALSFSMDTEFCRQHSYYPVLSLVQIGLTDGACYVVDMMLSLNYDGFLRLICAHSTQKIMHDPRQDIEILHYFSPQFTGENIWDIQLAALFLGYDSPPGYKRLVHDYCALELCKKLQYSDWSVRPLSAEHIHYAALDVLHSADIASTMHQLLQQNGKLAWFNEESDEWAGIRYTGTDLRTQAMKYVSHLHNFEHAATLVMVLAFRDMVARDLNVTPNKVLYQGGIESLCRRSDAAKIARAFAKIKKLKNYDFMLFWQQRNELHDDLANKIWQQAIDNKAHRDSDCEPLKQRIKRASQQLERVSRDLSINPSLIATKSNIHSVLYQMDKGLDVSNAKLMRGWRYDVLGHIFQ